MDGFLGILMLDTRFPRIPGDIGNPETFTFPVKKLVVEGCGSRRVVEEGDPALLEPFLAAAERLEREGALALTTSCGFLAMFQKELAAHVRIPVITSSLLQVPSVQAMLPEGKRAGILTASAHSLSGRHFAGAGIWKNTDPMDPENVPPIVYGMEGTCFYDVFIGDSPAMDRSRVEMAVCARARQMVTDHPEAGAIVFECTNMPPYAAAVTKETGLPVFDITTLCEAVMRSINPPVRS